MKSMFVTKIRLVVLIGLLIDCTSCQMKKQVYSEKQKSSYVEESTNYKIESLDLSMNPVKASFDVRIRDRFDKDALTQIAMDIKENYPGFTNYFILFWLPDMEIGSGAYATGHFTPNLFVNILGISEKDKSKMNDASTPEGQIIGKWFDGRSGVESTMVIYNISNVYNLRQVYKDGSYGDKLLKKSGSRFTYPNDFGEFLMIEADGSLGWYSANGRFTVATKID